MRVSTRAGSHLLVAKGRAAAPAFSTPRAAALVGAPGRQRSARQCWDWPGNSGKNPGSSRPITQKLAIRANPCHGLSDRQRDQLLVGDLPRRARARQPKGVSEHASCDNEVSSEAHISCSNHEVAELGPSSHPKARFLHNTPTHIKPLDLLHSRLRDSRFNFMFDREDPLHPDLSGKTAKDIDSLLAQ
jgi:hypothetical protein